MEIKFDILDYLGKFNDGVFVLLSLSFQDDFYEATFYYTKNMVALTVDERLEKQLNCEIEDWSGYNDLMVKIIQKVSPYEEIIVTLPEIDAGIGELANELTIADEVDSSEVVSATQSL